MSTQLVSTPDLVTLSQPIPSSARLWIPKRVLFTPDALEEPFGIVRLRGVPARERGEAV